MTDRARHADHRTERLLLRRPVVDDIGVLFEIHADPATNRFDPSRQMTTVDQAAAQFRDGDQHWRAHGFGYWVVSRATDAAGPVIGFAGAPP
ncbi:GNAT family N-acetyltransferase [Cryobacterium tepidiphilum]|uniref:N-acetyltransferase n=1 Tax=Cryobacterium tepidiphilum TaxID=2486026 RepID=A0A3M8L255_9MICO|nr:GNAT family N-acetyltransferase [Cryobacterium tepidiphilum]RNE59456.1 N-acetyltransferase [Cryobacterium tepidiphilum]